MLDEAINTFRKIERTEKRLEKLNLELRGWLRGMSHEEMCDYYKATAGPNHPAFQKDGAP